MNSNPSPTGKAKYAWREIDRVEPPKRPAPDRVADFRETVGDYDEATAREQARRCIQCPNPACVEACPLNCAIPELLALTADGQFHEAAELFFETHNIPELASHTCVGGRVCERDCILSGKSEPVPIRAITRFLLNYGWKNGLAEPAIAAPKGRSVAVIGSGICGLVTADALSRKGYAVTVFDSRQHPGGRMMNGLPGFRVDPEMVRRRVALLQQRGIHFRMGVTFGAEVKLSDLRRDFDAVFLGFGRAEAVELEVPGSKLTGVFQAAAFLAQNVGPGCNSAEASKTSVDVRGKRVVVLGAGDTAMDVVRSALRLGAAGVTCLYRRDEASLPADAEEYVNAQEEGAQFQFLAQPVAVLGNVAGAVTQLRCIRTELVPCETGRPLVQPVAGSEFDIPADVVFVAYGFTAPRLPQSDDFAKLEVDARGLLQVDANGMTNFPGVFAGGAIIRGPLPLVEVVQDARKATAALKAYLTALPAPTAAR
jgi:glutamate synthase (NADPH) small chain